MNVILYMATSANGYIAKANNETPWSDAGWESFAQKVSDVKNLVIGRKTFEIMQEAGDFEAIGNPFTVVVSSQKLEADNVVFVESPEAALRVLEEEGYAEVLIGGGALLNAAFMQQGLVDELYLDIEPMFFGKGIPLFSGDDFDVQLELLGTREVSKDVLQLHYAVRK